MAHKFRLDFDGQSVVQDDYNDLATEASTGEDHAYAQLFRLLPNNGATVYRGIVPYGIAATIVGNGASGSVLINPFRAIIGSRTEVSDDAVANYQDVRTGLSVVDSGTDLTTVVSLTANVSGNSRWDAIYAAVAVDAVSTPTTRKVKNPGTGVVTDESVSVYSHTSVTIGKVDGTPAGSPVFPAIPTDAGSVYYILLGYIRVPTGFGAGSTVAASNINDASACLAVSSTNGVANLRPATGNYRSDGAGIVRTGTSGMSNAPPQHWTGSSGSRPGVYMPSAMQGSESRLIALDFTDASSANWSHASLDILDDSIDWNSRIFKWSAWVGLTSSFPWNYSAGSPDFAHFLSGGNGAAPGYCGNVAHGAHILGMGNSMNFPSTGNNIVTLHASGGAATDIPAIGYNVPTNAMITATKVEIYTSGSPGSLKVKVTGVPLCMIFLWLEATGRFV